MNLPDLTCRGLQAQRSSLSSFAGHVVGVGAVFETVRLVEHHPIQERRQRKKRTHQPIGVATAVIAPDNHSKSRLVNAWLHAANRRPQTADRRPQTADAAAATATGAAPRAAGSVFSAVLLRLVGQANGVKLPSRVGGIASQPSQRLWLWFIARLLPESQDFTRLFVLPHLRLRLRPTTTGHHAPSIPSSSSTLSFDSNSSCGAGEYCFRAIMF
jgi:hypothetical protein